MRSGSHRVPPIKATYLLWTMGHWAKSVRKNARIIFPCFRLGHRGSEGILYLTEFPQVRSDS